MIQIFISYRRDGGDTLAQLFYDRLSNDGYHVFLDVESLRSGKFNTAIYSKIEECTDFLLILPEHGLDRCENEDDWVRLEIEYAIKLKKNIIPVMMRNFVFPDNLPESLAELRHYNGISANMELFDGVIIKLEKSLLLTPKPAGTTTNKNISKNKIKVRKKVNKQPVIIASAIIAILLVVIYFTCLKTSPPNDDVSLNAGENRTVEVLGEPDFSGVTRTNFEEYIAKADSGDKTAQYIAGEMNRTGTYVEQDYDKAFQYFKASAEQGLVASYNKLGICYAMGLGTPENGQEAISWYTKAAEAGDPNAQFNLGLEYYYGDICEKDYSKAFKYFSQSASGGYYIAHRFLGICYWNGLGVTVNLQKADEELLTAANAGDESAYIELIHFYVDTYYPTQAFHWAKKAIDSKDNEIKAQGYYWLSTFYRNGQVVTQDYQKALDCLNKAQELSDVDLSAAIRRVKILMGQETVTYADFERLDFHVTKELTDKDKDIFDFALIHDTGTRLYVSNSIVLYGFKDSPDLIGTFYVGGLGDSINDGYYIENGLLMSKSSMRNLYMVATIISDHRSHPENPFLYACLPMESWDSIIENDILVVIDGGMITGEKSESGFWDLSTRELWNVKFYSKKYYYYSSDRDMGYKCIGLGFVTGTTSDISLIGTAESAIGNEALGKYPNFTQYFENLNSSVKSNENSFDPNTFHISLNSETISNLRVALPYLNTP